MFVPEKGDSLEVVPKDKALLLAEVLYSLVDSSTETTLVLAETRF